MPPATVSKRTFKSPYWDVPPAGYETVTPSEYKAMQAAGQVPHSVVNPSSQILQGTKFAHPDPMAAARAAAAAINALLAKQGVLLPQNSNSDQYSSSDQNGANSKLSTDGKAPTLTRQARRLYVGNIPFNYSENELIDFFQANLTERGFVTDPGNPVLACQINSNKNFAFVEFRTIEEASAAMTLDGAMCNGQPLKVRRPHDYQPVAGSDPSGLNRGSESGAPSHHQSYGSHKSPTSCSMTTPVVLQVAGLTNIGTPRVLTEVLCLMNMVEEEELRDDQEYAEILEDIKIECSKFGKVKSIEIPRPLEREGDQSPELVPGVGKVFVEFDSATEAQRAQVSLAGRRFSNRVVVTSYFDRERFKNKEF